jgi:hypothetical protein
VLHATDAFTRATLAVVCDPSGGDQTGRDNAGRDKGGRDKGGRDKGEAEQALLDRMLLEHPDVFNPDRLWIMDGNFPDVARIKKMLPFCLITDLLDHQTRSSSSSPRAPPVVYEQ